MRHETDTALMGRVKAGETACLGELFERHHVRLHQFLLRMCGRRHCAEDMVQESFSRMLRHAASFRDGAAFLPWAFNVARNVAADYLNKEARHAARRDDGDPDLRVSELPGPEALQFQNREEGRLQRALLRLSPEQRSLILLGKLKELSCEELAALFGCSTGAVKVRLFRAMEALREASHATNESTITRERPHGM